MKMQEMYKPHMLIVNCFHRTPQLLSNPKSILTTVVVVPFKRPRTMMMFRTVEG